ncbi:PREDICTED: intercellular adhesion molecule 5, partial [Dipodomys ordii]|uniref:Intercellular adhesion molecule 5 n=1 Tax=Dipodomys ordii TaxID=10020 RepID=A0A1S3GL20_DIPOR
PPAKNQSLRNPKDLYGPLLDAPALDSVGCPERLTWLEGTEASLSCVAQGVPPPHVSCVRPGEVARVEGPLRVAREHAGTYRCQATNARGAAAKNVVVTVEYGPRFEELSCPSNWTWVEGSGKLFSCEVDGKPEPSVECVGPEGARDGVALPLASSNPEPRNPGSPSDPTPGVYLCNATNRHGSAIKTVVVSAECERGPDGRGSPWLWIAVGGAAGGAVLLAAGAGLAFYVQSTACKKGEYNVQEAESSGEAVCLNGAGAGAGGAGADGGAEQGGAAESPEGGEVFSIQLTSA